MSCELKISRVRVYPLRHRSGHLVADADVVLNGGFQITRLLVFEGGGQLFVSIPHDSTREQGDMALCQTLTVDLWEHISATVLDLFQNHADEETEMDDDGDFVLERNFPVGGGLEFSAFKVDRPRELHCNTVGTGSAVLNGQLLLKGFKIVAGPKRLSVAYPNDPSYKGDDYRPLFFPVTNELRTQFETLMLEHYWNGAAIQ